MLCLTKYIEHFFQVELNEVDNVLFISTKRCSLFVYFSVVRRGKEEVYTSSVFSVFDGLCCAQIILYRYRSVLVRQKNVHVCFRLE